LVARVCGAGPHLHTPCDAHSGVQAARGPAQHLPHVCRGGQEGKHSGLARLQATPGPTGPLGRRSEAHQARGPLDEAERHRGTQGLCVNQLGGTDDGGVGYQAVAAVPYKAPHTAGGPEGSAHGRGRGREWGRACRAARATVGVHDHRCPALEVRLGQGQQARMLQQGHRTVALSNVRQGLAPGCRGRGRVGWGRGGGIHSHPLNVTAAIPTGRRER
jgi:hypothetical protein